MSVAMKQTWLGVSRDSLVKARGISVYLERQRRVVFKLKKKSQSIAVGKAFNIVGAQGPVSFKVVKYDKKAKEKLTVNSSGKVTVKKKLKKGTYTLNVEVTAGGNDAYNPGSQIVTLKVRVK